MLFSAVALVTLFTACSKDDDKTIDPPMAKKFLVSRVSDSGDSLGITYDSTFRVTGAVNTQTAGGNTTYSYYTKAVYENGKIVEVTFGEKADAISGRQRYQYNAAGKLVLSSYYSSSSNEISSYDSLVYDANGRVAGYVSGDITDGVRSYYSKTNVIWDNKGNVIAEQEMQIEDGTVSKDTTFTTYTYDDKVNYIAKQPEFYFLEPEDIAFALSANNIKTSIRQSATSKDVFTNEYTYDADGYPVTQKETEEYSYGGETPSKRVNDYKIRYITK